MSLNIDKVIKEGYVRTFKMSGVIMVSIIFLLNFLNMLFGAGIVNRMIQKELFGSQSFFITSSVFGYTKNSIFVLPYQVPLILTILFSIASIIASIVAIRLFVGIETEYIPRKYFTRNIIRAFFNSVIGGILFGILVSIGFILLLIPGIFLYVSLVFWIVYIAVEDNNFVESFRNSWHLTKENRWSVFALILSVLFVVSVLNIVFLIPFFSVSLLDTLFDIPGIVLGKLIGILIAQIGSALATVFSISTISIAYKQLKNNSRRS